MCYVTVLLGTLWSSIKQIEASYVFDWENAISLHAMQGNRDSSRGEGEVYVVIICCSKIYHMIIENKRKACFISILKSDSKIVIAA